MGTIIQILVNSIISGVILSLVAIGFAYIFRVTKVFHLAHAGIYVTGGYASWWLFSKTGNWIEAAIFSSLIVSALIFIFEKTVYLPLSKKQPSQTISLIASMGLYVMMINIIAMIFGNEIKIFYNTPSDSFQQGQIIITQIQMIQFCISLLLIFCSIGYLWTSGTQLTMRAIADSEMISKIFGINTEKERLKVFFIGSILAGIAAMLKSLETGLDPRMGMNITLTATVVTILSARLNIWLIVALSVVLTLLQNFIEWFLNPQWRDGLTFLLLLIVIIYKTEGIISYNLRKDRI